MPRPPIDLLAMLREPTTRQVLGALSRGEDPRDLAAEAAVRLFRREVGKALGAPGGPAASAKSSVKPAKTDPDPDIIDVEYRVIDVTPGVKKRTKKESP